MLDLHLVDHLLRGSPVVASLGLVLVLEAVLALVLALGEVTAAFLGQFAMK